MRAQLGSAFLQLLTLASCGGDKAADHPETNNVEIASSAPEGCLELGNAEGKGADREAAEADLRAKAARSSASHAVVDADQRSDTSIPARLYACR